MRMIGKRILLCASVCPLSLGGLCSQFFWVIFILNSVYDWRKFQYRSVLHLKDASIKASIHISRTINEVGIELNFDLKDDKLDLQNIEDKAYNFWRYVEDYFGAPPKE